MRISDWSSDVCSSDLASRNWWPLRSAPRLIQDAVVRFELIPYASGIVGGYLAEFHAGPPAACHWSEHSLYMDGDVFEALVFLVGPSTRSEEHTSELQSLMRISYAVFCLKKKN